MSDWDNRVDSLYTPTEKDLADARKELEAVRKGLEELKQTFLRINSMLADYIESKKSE